jgi:hypothetical protein
MPRLHQSSLAASHRDHAGQAGDQTTADLWHASQPTNVLDDNRCLDRAHTSWDAIRQITLSVIMYKIPFSSNSQIDTLLLGPLDHEDGHLSYNTFGNVFAVHPLFAFAVRSRCRGRPEPRGENKAGKSSRPRSCGLPCATPGRRPGATAGKSPRFWTVPAALAGLRNRILRG